MTALRARWQRVRGTGSYGSAVDLAVVGAAFVLDVTMFSARGLSALEVVIAFVGCLPLLWRRRAPVVVFGIVGVYVLAAALLLPELRPTVGLPVALGTVAARRGLGVSTAALVATIAIMAPRSVVDELRDNPEDPAISTAVYVFLLYVIIASGAFGIGRWSQRNTLAMGRLEVESRKRAAEAVRTERRRIALELHDIISHSVSVMVLQSAGARKVLGSDPARAEEALARIEAVGKQSMGELRRMLGVLHDSPEDVNVERTHQRLEDIDAMIHGLQLSGLDVTLVEEGDRVRLDPSVDLSAYRIVQEALTNCVKHSRGATVVVTLVWSGDELEVDVVDDGGAPALPELSTEHGLPGLRERARAVGGRLEAGPIPTGGFRVHANLPVSSTAAEAEDWDRSASAGEAG